MSPHNVSSRSLPVSFAPMTLRDVPDVDRLERRCFPTPWSASTYRHELRHNPRSHYWVVRPRLELLQRVRASIPSLLGYGGYWLIVDEAHIVTFATHPAWRRRKVGTWLLINMLGEAREAGALQATLEVRAGNVAAKTLYARLGFIEVGYRKEYYPRTDPEIPGEDAVLMTLFGLDIDKVWQELQRQRDAITFALPD